MTVQGVICWLQWCRSLHSNDFLKHLRVGNILWGKESMPEWFCFPTACNVSTQSKCHRQRPLWISQLNAVQLVWRVVNMIPFPMETLNINSRLWQNENKGRHPEYKMSLDVFFICREMFLVMAYLCSWTARVSVCGDTVHLTSFALGQSPHSTVQFSSREVTRNNTSDIENDGEREGKRGNPHCCFLWPKKKNQKIGAKRRSRNLSWGAQTRRCIHRLPFT